MDGRLKQLSGYAACHVSVNQQPLMSSIFLPLTELPKIIPLTACLSSF
jgi:hypothetical protein